MKSILFVLALFASPTFAGPIEDNSILLEEAYNQEPGVYQFMLKYDIEKNKDWSLQFDNEIPVGGQTHQLSYSVPFRHADSANKDEFGDAVVSYRYQLMNEEKTALAPRFGLVIPHEGGMAAEFNFAASFKVHPRFVMHANAGVKFDPEAGPADRAELETSYGLSGIYRISDNFDFMLESKGEGDDLFLAPAVRAAINAGTWQFVPALAYSHNVKPYSDEHSVIAYFSAEGPL